MVTVHGLKGQVSYSRSPDQQLPTQMQTCSSEHLSPSLGRWARTRTRELKYSSPQEGDLSRGRRELTHVDAADRWPWNTGRQAGDRSRAREGAGLNVAGTMSPCS